MFMQTPVERKFEEYIGNINSILIKDEAWLSDPLFINRLLDKLENIKRSFIFLCAEKEDVYAYQEQLSKLCSKTQAVLDSVSDYQPDPEFIPATRSVLIEKLFLLHDLFATSQNLIKSFYPVI
jgi:hypothetical protein